MGTAPTSPQHLPEVGVVASCALAFAFVALAIAATAGPVYLSADGAHAVTDARALVGMAPRTFTYLPAWPAMLLPLVLAGLSPAAAVTFWLTVITALLFAGLYALSRPFVSSRSALVGAAFGASSTAVAELLGWQGGATYLGTAALVFALAALLRWARLGRRRDGLLVGVCFAVVIAAHPFVAVAGAFLLGLLWLSELLASWEHRAAWGPFAVRGLLIAIAVPVLVALVLLPRYLAIDVPTRSTVRFPDLSTVTDLVAWLVRETPALALLGLVACVAALTAARPLRVVSGGVAAIFIVLPACLSGDASYQSRVAYLVPILLSIGGAAAWQWVDVRLDAAGATTGQPSELARLAGPVFVAILLASIAFPTRLAAATRFYSPLAAEDQTLITSLAASHGAIATSWSENNYWEGLTNSWLVEGLTNRPAIGPSDPTLSTRRSERVDSAAAWQLFAGERVIENGALQIGLGPSGWRADPALAANLFGYYIPLVHISDAVNDYGPVSGGAPSPMVWSVSDNVGTGIASVQGSPAVRATASLVGARATLGWARVGKGAPGAWTIWLWPAYGLPWRNVQEGSGWIQFEPWGGAASRDEKAWAQLDPRVRVGVEAPATMRYVASDPRWHLQALAVTVPAGSDLSLSIDVSGTPPAGRTEVKDERSLISSYGITTALVWRDTGWTDRFADSACWRASTEDQAIVAFEVAQSCRAPGS